MRRREIFIELTGLLDVILILLFALLMQAKTQTGTAVESAAAAEEEARAAQEELAEVRQERDRLAEELGVYEREGITVGVVEENSLVVTLSVQGRQSRIIRIEPRGGATQRVDIDPEDENYSFNSLHTKLSKLIADAGKETVFVVFQYDRSAIYEKDYNLVGRVLLQLKQEAKRADIALNYIETDITAN